MSTPDRLTDEEPRVTLTRDTALELAALGRRAQNDPGQFVKRIHPDDYRDYERLDRWQARALDVAVDTWLAARLAAQPPATDRDALLTMLREHGYVSTSLNLDGIDGWGIRCSCGHQEPWAFENVHADIWHDEHRVDAFLAARPAPDTLADRVQALADRWDAVPPSNFDFINRERRRLSAELRALLAGRSDASPEGGEQRG